MIINAGSINIDHVYRVKALPEPGETIASTDYQRHLGGKGINQSIAIARSGAEVVHAGAVGQDGDWALEQIASFGVATTHIAQLSCATGHAIITVDDEGENQIIIEGGANRKLTSTLIEAALTAATPDRDWVLLQNETNMTTEIVALAKAAKLKVAYAAAPFIAETTLALLPDIDLLAVNEGEAAALGAELGVDPMAIPVPQLLITKGAKGSVFIANGKYHEQSAFKVIPVDTTGAGDTFLGAFLAHFTKDGDVSAALRFAAAASAIQVTRKGAAPAIPHSQVVLQFMIKAETG